MKHIWVAIDLCQRKLVNERERVSAAQANARAEIASRSGAAATVDRISDAIAEIEAELRAVTAARKDFQDLYGEPREEVGA